MLTNTKTKAILIIILAWAMAAIAASLLENSYEYKTYGTYESPVALLGISGFVLQIYGFIMLAQVKGRSIILGVALSLFSLLGLFVMLVLKDRSHSSKR